MGIWKLQTILQKLLRFFLFLLFGKRELPRKGFFLHFRPQDEKKRSR